MTLTALVLAGSRAGFDPVAHYAGVADKALISLAGRTLLQRVVDALREAGATRIVVVASSSAVRDHAASLGVETIGAASGPSASTARGFALLGAPLLVTTADHALLEAGWITRFIAAVPGGADVAALLANRRTVERDAPMTRRTYLRFADDHWSGCNLFYLGSPNAARAIAFWEAIEANRKSPWKIIRRLGPGFLLRYVVGYLTIDAALQYLGKKLNINVSMVPSVSGLASIDVDKASDLDLVRTLAAQR